ncbi:D-ala D-ala ligase N-terminus [Megamonas hypermegale ART12/1]|nr:D-ala D-ala ligase N-terminus [Megamonas hypermegale ART12/1]
MNFKKIVVLMGGPSSEAEISRLTGTAILNALQEKGYNAVGMEFVPKTLVEDIKKVAVILYLMLFMVNMVKMAELQQYLK